MKFDNIDIDINASIEDKAWLEIAKVDQYDNCEFDENKAKAVLTTLINEKAFEHQLSLELKAYAFLRFAEIEKKLGDIEQSCKIAMFDTTSLEIPQVIYYRYALHRAQHCSKNIKQSYAELMRLKHEVSQTNDPLLMKNILDAIYGFFVEQGEVSLSIDINNILITQFKSQQSSYHHSLSLYFQVLDYISLNRIDDANHFLDLLEAYTKQHQVEEFKLLINVAKLNMSFKQKDYQNTLHYLTLIDENIPNLTKYTQSGKFYFIKAISCLELNNDKCAEEITSNIENYTYDNDKNEPLLYYLKALDATKHSLPEREELKNIQAKWQSKTTQIATNPLLKSMEKVAANTPLAKADYSATLKVVLPQLFIILVLAIYFILIYVKKKIAAQLTLDLLTKTANFDTIYAQLPHNALENTTSFYGLLDIDINFLNSIQRSFEIRSKIIDCVVTSITADDSFNDFARLEGNCIFVTCNKRTQENCDIAIANLLNKIEALIESRGLTHNLTLTTISKIIDYQGKLTKESVLKAYQLLSPD